MCGFHDATIEAVQIGVTGQLVIVLNDMNFFYKSSNSRVADVWLCRATLSYSGFSRVGINLAANASASISDVTIRFKIPVEEDKYHLTLMNGKECVKSQLTLITGDQIEVEGGIGRLELVRKIRFLEQFDLTE